MSEPLMELPRAPDDQEVPGVGNWWPRLTRHEPKYRFYADESYFRESWEDVREELGGNRFQILQGHALVIFKPDAVVARKIEPALALLREHAFIPVLAQRIRLDRLNTRELWRYQWNAATLDRLAVCDLLTTATDSLWVVLRDAAPRAGIPASVRLAGVKGSPQPHERRHGDLRAELQSPNRMITFMHVADEPADLVRELGILFDRNDRRAILTALRDSATLDATLQVLSFARALARENSPVVLDPQHALCQLVDAVEAAATRGAPAGRIHELRKQLQGCQAGKPLGWFGFVNALREAGVEPRLWDLILVGAEWITPDEERAAVLDGDVCLQGWTAEQATADV